MNSRIILLVVGLVVGGLAGWFTAPAPAVDMKIGPVSVEVQKDGDNGTSVTATGEGGGEMNLQVGEKSMLSDRTTRAGVFGVIGAVIGLAIGFFVDRRRIA
jgi:uncharacterized membrane protein YeaQ/YmgE (transglycosylase-associated protein family)